MKSLELIKRFQKAQGVTDVSLCALLGQKSPSYLYNIRSGLHSPSPVVADTMTSILTDAGYLETTEDQLLFWRDFVSLNARARTSA